MGSQPASMEIFLLCFFFFDVLLFMLMMRRFRPKSGMKNCNLLNRIVPPARQSRRNFTNESAENLGTKLYNGHIGTIGRPVMTSRNYPASSIYAVRSRPSFFHHQPPAGVRAIHEMWSDPISTRLKAATIVRAKGPVSGYRMARR